MRIITYKAIEQYAQHADARIALDEWYMTVDECEWNCFGDIKQTFDSVGNKRYVFNIKGNSHRIVALILFVPKIVYIRFIGTHAEYDKIKDCSTI